MKRQNNRHLERVSRGSDEISMAKSSLRDELGIIVSQGIVTGDVEWPLINTIERESLPPLSQTQIRDSESGLRGEDNGDNLDESYTVVGKRTSKTQGEIESMRGARCSMNATGTRRDRDEQAVKPGPWRKHTLWNVRK
jgi:hypothetical protein